VIRLDHATVERRGSAVVTTFTDGAESVSEPPDTDWHRQIVGWVGCGDDLERYWFEHEFLHSFLAQAMHGRPSYVVWMEAHGKAMNMVGALYEERWVYHFHRYLNDVAGPVEPEWPGWKAQALELLRGDE
jgi:hypothetical protein